MTDPDYKALCAELLTDYDNCHYRSELSDRAHAALSQPEPAPTDKELADLLYYEFTTSTGHGERTDEIGFARAVLAKWGRQ